MSFQDLTPEQIEKAKACKSPEELLALAQSEGYELSDEELQSVSGGEWCSIWCYEQGPCANWFPH